jgi:hypothetical protein
MVLVRILMSKSGFKDDIIHHTGRKVQFYFLLFAVVIKWLINIFLLVY